MFLLISVKITAEFDGDYYAPNWMDGESFDYRDFLPAVPPVDTEISGVADHDGRRYCVRVHKVEMTAGDSEVRVYGMVIS